MANEGLGALRAPRYPKGDDGARTLGRVGQGSVVVLVARVFRVSPGAVAAGSARPPAGEDVLPQPVSRLGQAVIQKYASDIC